jgi:four helix bundle protein
MRVYEQAMKVVRLVAGTADAIGRQDRDLVNQLKRATSSVPLNLAEGLGHKGGNREQRFHTALGSAREVAACLDVAVAWGYLGSEAEVIDEADYLVCMLYRLVHSRR